MGNPEHVIVKHSPKLSLWHRFLCWLGIHKWIEMMEGCCWVNIPITKFDLPHSQYLKCSRCGVEEDYRCDLCKAEGPSACINRAVQEMREASLRKNCCLHCPATPHSHC